MEFLKNHLLNIKLSYDRNGLYPIRIHEYSATTSFVNNPDHVDMADTALAKVLGTVIHWLGQWPFELRTACFESFSGILKLCLFTKLL